MPHLSRPAESDTFVLLRELVDSYDAGMSLRDLAERTGWSRARVRRTLVAGGCLLREQVLLPTDRCFWDLKLQSGAKVHDLAEELQVTTTTIHRHLRAASLQAAIPKTFDQWLQDRTCLDGECLRWQGALHPVGYGVAYYEGCIRLAHRIVWEQNYGTISDEYFILHVDNCRFLDCLNISHLRMDNVNASIQARVAAHQFAWGEKHGNAKLTENEARLILDSNQPVRVLAERFAVTAATVRAIRTGRRWKHLHD